MYCPPQKHMQHEYTESFPIVNSTHRSLGGWRSNENWRHMIVSALQEHGGDSSDTGKASAGQVSSSTSVLGDWSTGLGVAGNWLAGGG